jgi:transposase
MNAPPTQPSIVQGRIVGLDLHPDSFAAAILAGRDPHTSKVVRTATRVPLAQLEAWLRTHTLPEDLCAFEASSNSFAIAERLAALGRRFVLLESHRAGQIKKSYCANDRLDAIKLARIQLSGLARTPVWCPDPQTRERRELLATYQRCVKDCTRHAQHLRSFLNEHCLRLPAGFRLCRPEALERLLALKAWSLRQRQLIEDMHGTLIAARARRQRLRRLMALEIEAEPKVLRLYKLCGLNLITTYALVAVVGDIRRFANSKRLVAYLGLNPSVAESGSSEGGTALRPHGRGPLRALLVQAAKRLLTCQNPLQKWGLALALRRGRNRAAVALARKLTVSVWHVMMDHWSGVKEVTTTLRTKLFKLATELGVPTLQQLGYSSKAAFEEQKLTVLQSFP